MKIKLDKELKVALLEAVKLGEIDTDIFPVRRQEDKMTLRDIAVETARLQKLNKETLQDEAALMCSFARDELTTEEYINALTNLWQYELDKNNISQE